MSLKTSERCFVGGSLRLMQVHAGHMRIHTAKPLDIKSIGIAMRKSVKIPYIPVKNVDKSPC